MANWKERINVEVLLPFDTPNCTTSWYWVMFSIAMNEVWCHDGVWMYNAGDYANNAPFRLNICGEAKTKRLYTDHLYGIMADINYTTHKLMACRAYSLTTDPRHSKIEHFKVRYVSHDVELSDNDRRSMRLHSIDYGGGRIERRDR